MLSKRYLSLLTVAFIGLSASAEQATFAVGNLPSSASDAKLPRARGTLHRFSIGPVKQILDVAQEHDLDIWRTTSEEVDIYLPDSSPPLPPQLQALPHTKTPIWPTKPVSVSSRWEGSSLDNTTFHSAYHPLYEVDTFLNDLHLAYPNTSRLINLGHSAEGREMLGISISTGGYDEEGDNEGAGGNGKKKKKKGRIPIGNPDQKLGFVIMGAQHAREWVASSAALYLAQALLADTSQSHSLSSLLQHFDFHIVPIPNPDGYDYTWQTDRYWYKNRQVLGPDAKCVGLDMNRNWGYKWKPGPFEDHILPPTNHTLGRNTCSHWYPGSRAFESPEVNNIANWVTTLPNVVAFLDLRSYGQMISIPYSYSCKKNPPDAEDQFEAAIGASQAIKSEHGTEYKVGRLCQMLYPAPGNVVDWMYMHPSIKYAYVAHLRDTGTYGFTLPEKWIRPTGEETTNLVNYISRFVATQAKRKF